MSDKPANSEYANARQIDDPHEVTLEVVRVLPGLNFDKVLRKLSSGKSFVYLKRGLTPHQQSAIKRRGIPGLSFEKGARRVDQYGPLAAHVIGANERLNATPSQVALDRSICMRLMSVPSRWSRLWELRPCSAI